MNANLEKRPTTSTSFIIMLSLLRLFARIYILFYQKKNYRQFMNKAHSLNRPDSSAENQARRQDKFFEQLVGTTTPDLKSSVATQDAGQAFEIVSEFKPSGDQPSAIGELTQGLENSLRDQVLLGVTGSGKTFSMAHVIQNVQRPTLILAPNKTLAAQLFGEMKTFFPNNAVEYFVSYYDYYLPEAYVPRTDTYVEKEASINE